MNNKLLNLIIFLLIFFFGLFGLAKSSWTATIQAASCSQADVQAAITATSAGGTVTVPAGTCTWNTAITIDKGLSLIGAGSGAGGTTIKGSKDNLIIYSPDDLSANLLFRISAFKFDLDHQPIHGLQLYASDMYGGPVLYQKKIRVDHNVFVNLNVTSTQWKYIMTSGVRGVVDNNTFGDSFYPFRSATSYFSDTPPRTCYSGCREWQQTEGIVFGQTDNNMWFEDNDITISDHGQGLVITDGQEGQRCGFRYNTVHIGSTGYSQLFDWHGNYGDGDGSTYSTMGVEVYGNNFLGGAGAASDGRGGRSFLFLNNYTGSFSFVIYEEHAASGTPITYTGPNPPQYSQDVNGTYFFGNRTNYTGTNISVDINETCGLCIPGALVAGKNFFTDTSTPGVSCGPLANRPESCTTGQAYWATNQSACTDLTNYVGAGTGKTPLSGTFYRCAANAWDGGSTLLTYPHPLRGGDGDTTPPAAPTGLSVQ